MDERIRNEIQDILDIELFLHIKHNHINHDLICLTTT